MSSASGKVYDRQLMSTRQYYISRGSGIIGGTLQCSAAALEAIHKALTIVRGSREVYNGESVSSSNCMVGFRWPNVSLPVSMKLSDLAVPRPSSAQNSRTLVELAKDLQCTSRHTTVERCCIRRGDKVPLKPRIKILNGLLDG